MKRLSKIVFLGLLGLAVGIQLIPYGREHTNPPVTAEAEWNSSSTRELVVSTCFDCHSNETTWPWYSHVAPVSWLVQSDVDEAREHLNFSEFDRPQPHAHHAAEEVEDGEMPPWQYRIGHSSARLTDSERELLVSGLTATFGGDE